MKTTGQGHCFQGAHCWMWSNTAKDHKANAQDIRRPWQLWKEESRLYKAGGMVATDNWWQTRQHAKDTHKMSFSPHKSFGSEGVQNLSHFTPESRLSDFPILSQVANGPVSKDLAGLRTPPITKPETIILHTLPPSSTWKTFTAYSTGARVHHARNKLGQGIHEFSTQNQTKWIDWSEPLLLVNSDPNWPQPSVSPTETWKYLF